VIRPGEPWGAPTADPPDLEVAGGDADLAAAAASSPGALVRFLPDPASDLARAVGLRAGEPAADQGLALPVDVLALGEEDGLACNMCVLGTPPDRLRRLTAAYDVEVDLDGKPWFAGRATTVVIANGQFLRGLDLVPRGHPGDGRAEVQVYALRRGERRAMRKRLPTGTHVPHPRIRARTAAAVEVRASGPVPMEVDGEARAPVAGLRIRVATAAFRLRL
jgi:hypothetical protein